MIRCQEAANFFQQCLDRELSAEDLEHLEEHIRMCRHCFGNLEFDRSLRAVLKKHSLKSRISKEAKDLIQKKLTDLPPT